MVNRFVNKEFSSSKHIAADFLVATLVPARLTSPEFSVTLQLVRTFLPKTRTLPKALQWHPIPTRSYLSYQYERRFHRIMQGFFFCFAIDDLPSFTDLDKTYEDICQNNENCSLQLLNKSNLCFCTDPSLYKVVAVLVGLKADREDYRQVSVAAAEHFAKSKGMRYFEVSGKDDINVDKAIFTLSSLVAAKLNISHC